MNTTKTRRRGVIVTGVLSTIALAGLAFGVSLEHIYRMRTSRTYPAPGRTVDVGDGVSLQVDCRGKGLPTVVLESGLDIYGSLSWSAVHDSIAATTRACAYSRKGIMWSTGRSASFDVETSARQLHSALTKLGEPAPYVMVGHSIGGPYNVVFASLFPGDVAGFVMVDASHPDQFAQFERAAGKSLQPSATLPRLVGRLSWTGVVRAIPLPTAPDHWPQLTRDAGQAFLTQSVAGYAAELAAIPATLASARTHDLGDRPLIVLSVSDAKKQDELATMGLSAGQGARLDEAHRKLAADMATWSSRGRLELVPGSTHSIQMDRPDVVIRAVREVVSYVIAHDSAPPYRRR
ncbi:MAG TPA: alpha/beta hydrolase [Gemmatimonadaceae bacterium]|nr:alpha/beta hydrolase [Gemmatimonadaceae bacterium]